MVNNEGSPRSVVLLEILKGPIWPYKDGEQSKPLSLIRWMVRVGCLKELECHSEQGKPRSGILPVETYRGIRISSGGGFLVKLFKTFFDRISPRSFRRGIFPCLCLSA